MHGDSLKQRKLERLLFSMPQDCHGNKSRSLTEAALDSLLKKISVQIILRNASLRDNPAPSEFT
jgi:hypothetical protein